MTTSSANSITVAEYAILAAAAYNDNRGDVNKVPQYSLPPGWVNDTRFNVIDNSGLSTLSSGFGASTFVNGNTRNVVISFEGTDFLTDGGAGQNDGQTAKDLAADLLLGIGSPTSSQIIQAAMLYEQVKAAFPANQGYTISFTGHSLGAGLASIMAVWFNLPATVFADAPFLATAQSISAVALAAAAILPTYDSALTSFAAYSAVPIYGLLAGVWARESNVTAYYVQGELLNHYDGWAGNTGLFPGPLSGKGTVVGNGQNHPIPVGGGDAIGPISLHSIVLHALLLMNAQFGEDTIALPTLLAQLFSTSLYAKPQQGQQPDFITMLMNASSSSIGTSNAGASALALFSADLAKLWQPNVTQLQSSAMISAIVAATIEDYYWQMFSDANAQNYKGLDIGSFLYKVSGGVNFNLSDITDNIGNNPQLGRQQLVSAADQLLATSDSTAANIIASATIWYVQSGSSGMTASGSGTIGNDVLIGGGTGNNLIGGNGNNVLIGGIGNDTLTGGTGSGIDYFQASFDGDLLNGNSTFSDKYVFVVNAATPGTDTINDESGAGTIWIGNNQLTGPGTGITATISTATNGHTIETWTGGGATYQFDTTTNNLTITGSAVGPGDTLVIDNFNLAQAGASGGYLGIKLTSPITLAAGVSATLPINPQNAVTATGNEQTFTLYASTPSTTAQTYTLSGGGSSDFLAIGSNLVPLSGPVNVIIPAGQSSITVGLIDGNLAQGTAPLAQTVSLTATSQGDSQTSNTLAVTFNGPSSSTSGGAAVAAIAESGPSGGFTYYLDPNSGAQGYTNATATATNGQSFIALNSGNDVVNGGSGSGFIVAGNGNDQINAGSAGGYYISAGNGNDSITATNGNNLVETGTGSDTIVLGAGQNTVVGGIVDNGAGLYAYSDPVLLNWSASNTWTGASLSVGLSASNVNFTGGGGTYGLNGTTQTTINNQLQLGAGNEAIYGGTGNNVYFLSVGNNYVNAGGGNDYIQGNTGNNTILGGAGNDTIWGAGGNDYINAQSGNDAIVGQGGDMTIFGGTGNDTIFGGDGNASWATSQTGNSYLNAGGGNTQLYGAGGSDTLIGGSGNDSLYAGAGTEYLQAGSGATTMIGGAGNDSIACGSGNDSVNAGTGNTTINGGSGIDTIWGGAGTNVISAGDGGTSNTNYTMVTAGAGNTTITGGSGIDLLVGGSGTDVINVGNGGTSSSNYTEAKAGSGNTTITGGAGVDLLIGGSGSNVIYAGNGGTTASPTQVVGGSGNATIYGGAGVYQITVGGNDTIVAGGGTGDIIGGGGTATYQIGGSSGDTAIYSSSAGDTLQFGQGITIANTTVSLSQQANGNFYVVTLSSGATVFVQTGGLSQVTFGDGTVASLAQLVTPQFTIDNTTYATTNTVLSSATTPQNLTLTGSSSISATGNNVNNVLTANSGNDTLIAGTASDTLVGGGSGTSEDYVVSAATGTVTTVNGSTASDTLNFTGSVTLADLSLSTAAGPGGTVVATLQNSQGGSVVITGDASGDILDQIAFADGSSASLGDMLAQLTTGPTAATSAANVTLAVGIQNMTLTGNAISATGNAQEDVIIANGANDTLIAGSGNDTLSGGGGTTTYQVGLGNLVTITNSSSTDTLAFAVGINENDLTTTSASVNGVTVVTIFDDQGSEVVIQGGALNQVTFANGDTATLTQLLAPSYTEGATTFSTVNATAGAGITALTMTGDASVTATANTLNDTLTSNSGNDTLIAGTGHDTLVGGGATTYMVGTTSGVTTINQGSQNDILSFGTGITASDLSATAALASDGSTTVTIQDSQGNAVIVTEYTSGMVDQLSFANGSTASLGAILAQATTGISAATSATNVTLAEGTQNMLLTGSASIAATGNDDDDVITSNSGNDTLIAGTANDTLVGGSGANTYDVSAGSNVTITNSGSGDILAFGTGIAQTDLTATSANGVATIIDDQGGTITIQGTLSQVSFASGATATLSQLLASSYTNGTTEYSSASVTAGSGIVALTMTGSANVTATANTLNDTITSNSGNDTLVAGSGNDTLVGGSGRTTYQVGLGSGITTISQAGDADVLSFGAGITSAIATAALAPNGSRTVTIQGSQGNAVVVNNYSAGSVDQLEFSNGSTASLSALLAHAITGITAMTSSATTLMPAGIQNLTLTGSANLDASGNGLDDVITANSGNDVLIAGTANDTLIAGSGNDTLAGGGGNATYELDTTFVTHLGSETTTILQSVPTDTLLFAPGTTIGDLVVDAGAESNGFNDVAIVDEANNTVTVLQPNANGGMADQLQFSDGSTASLGQLLAQNTTGPTAMTSAVNVNPLPAGIQNLTLTGSANLSATGNNLADVITANSGNDTLTAGTGNDTLIGGAGSDSFVGGSGGTTLIVGSGNDTFIAEGGNAIISAETSGTLTIQNGTDADILYSPTFTFDSAVNTNGVEIVTLTDDYGGTIVIDGGEVELDTEYEGMFSLSQIMGIAPATVYSASNAALAPGATNLTLTGNANLTATGNNLNDVITGNAGNDTLIADSGFSTLDTPIAGGNEINTISGFTTLVGGTGNDTFVLAQSSINGSTTTIIEAPNSGSNTEETPVDTDLSANVQNLTGTGADNILLYGNNLNNVITANSGNDTLNAGSGLATLIGGSGNDTFIVNSTGDVVEASSLSTQNVELSSVSTVAPANIQELGGTGSNNLTLTGDANCVVYANSGSDTLIAGGENDTLDDTAPSGGNYDVMIGYSGGSTVYSVGASTIILNSQSNDTLDLINLVPSASDIYATSSNVNGVTDVTLIMPDYSGVVEIEGGALSKVNVNGVITTISQLLTQNAATDVAADTVLPTSDNFVALTGNASLDETLNSANGVIVGNSGNDTLIAGAANDNLVGGIGNDTFIFTGAGTGEIIESPNNGNNTEETSSTAVLAQNVQSLIGLGSANIDLSGNGVIAANSGNDLLDAGNSVTSGSATLIGGTGNDTLGGYSGYESPGSSVTYVVNSGDGNINIVGSDNPDVLEFGTGITASSISASSTGTGSSTVVTLAISGGNTVTIDNPIFNDVSFANGTTTTLAALVAQTKGTLISSATTTVMPAPDTVLVLTGAAGISGTGNSLADTIVANSGNDTLIAGSGLATLIGGSGNDTFVINNASDVITEATNSGGNTEESSISTTLAANVQNLIGTGTAALLLMSDAPASVITSNSGNDTLQGEGGQTTLVAGTGNDILDGNTYFTDGVGSDNNYATTFLVNAGDGNTTIDNSGNADVLAFGAGITAGDIVATSTGSGSATVVTLTVAGGHSVTINYPDFTEVTFAGGGSTTLAALLVQSETVITSSVSTVLPAGNSILTLTGNANISGTGNNLPDTITANSGNDTLIAGTGLATLVGGSGNDTFEINNAADVITEAANSGNNTEQTSVSTTLAANVQNLVGIGSTNISLIGNNLTNVITANSGNDYLYAGIGQATLVAGIGNDSLVGDGGHATPLSTTYLFNSGDGNTLIYNDVSSDILEFGAGITASSITASNFVATAANYNGGFTGDTMVTVAISGGNSVTIDSPTFTEVSFVGGGTTTLAALLAAGNSITSSTSIVMPAGATKLTLTGTGNISGTGNSLADTIIANSGNDTLIAGSGLATLVGGTGNDTFEINNTGDVITEAANTGNNIEQSTVSTTLATNVQNLTGTGTAALTLTGNNLANTITANTGADTLVAGSGLATLVGGTGNDTFIINNASDVITKATNTGSNLEQTSVSTTIAANVQKLTGTGTAALTLTGGATADTITANSGADTLIAGSAVATLVGGSGNDTFEINNASDVITEAANTGNNTEQTSVTATLAANVQNLTATGSTAVKLTGNTLNNVITANTGADTLVAGSGNDTLVSGTGVDSLTGGAGNDTFVVNNASDVVTKATNTGSNTEQTSVSITVAANLQNLTGTGTGALTLTGNTTATTITANSGADTLIAGTGVATLVGGAGNDTFEINNASDVITKAANTGNNTEQSSVSTTVAANVQNLTGTGSTAISLTGNSLNNVITANTGADTLVAGSGNDTLTSGTGNDSMTGGAGNDTFIVNNTNDKITASTAKAGNVVQSTVSYVLPANLLNLTATGTGSVSLTGNTLADTITANTGNDTLISGTGIDTLVGSTGNDTFEVNNSSDAITVTTAKAGNVTQSSVNYVLPANLLSLTGTGSTAISLTANTLADTITANTGTDTLISGTGIDTLVGGTGNDTFVVNNASDVVTKATNTGSNTEQTSVTATLAANVQNLTGTGTGALTLTGNASADKITANSGNDTLIAGTGIATLVGGSGNDTFTINNASDVITEAANTGNNTEDTSVTATLAANVQNLTATGSTAVTLTGNTLNDVITGNTGADKLVAGAGNDTLTAGSGNDSLTGGAGNDVFNVNNIADVVTATSGTNVNTINTSVTYTAATNVEDLFVTGTGTVTATGNTGNDLIIGSSGANTLVGGSGASVLEAGSGATTLKDTAAANALIGGAGNDTMTGGTGADFIVGGAGNDAITLGAGTAVVAFNTGDGKATIAAGTGLANVLSLGDGIAYANLSFSKSGNNLILNTGGNNAITFTNWYAGSADQNFVTLQVLEQSASTYSASSSNVLYNSDVEEFNFTKLVAAFNAALTATPTLTSWSLSNSLLTDHLSGSNTTALGGDLAYYDGLNGNLTGMNLATAVTTLGNSTYGKTAQTIDAWSGISAGSNRLH